MLRRNTENHFLALYPLARDFSGHKFAGACCSRVEGARMGGVSRAFEKKWLSPATSALSALRSQFYQGIGLRSASGTAAGSTTTTSGRPCLCSLWTACGRSRSSSPRPLSSTTPSSSPCWTISSCVCYSPNPNVACLRDSFACGCVPLYSRACATDLALLRNRKLCLCLCVLPNEDKEESRALPNETQTYTTSTLAGLCAALSFATANTSASR